MGLRDMLKKLFSPPERADGNQDGDVCEHRKKEEMDKRVQDTEERIRILRLESNLYEHQHDSHTRRSH